MHATSRDGSAIYYERTGDAPAALVFVHGWMGNVRWWDAQRDAFASDYQVVALDLAGHGRSSRTRRHGSATAYADDIVAVVREIDAERIVLVGHSMSGAYAVLAGLAIDRLAAVVLVDTLKDLDSVLPADQREAMFAMYRADYRNAVATMLPQYLFAAGTPAAVIDRLSAEFLAVTGDVAVDLLAPLYDYDVRQDASRLRVPVRAINTDLHPTAVGVNRRYFADYEVTTLPGYGHYPMLETPATFNVALRQLLDDLGRGARSPRPS